MKDDQSQMINALNYAIQMEIDGKKFYAKAVRNSHNHVGKDLFSWLARQEDRHRENIQSIYDAIIMKKGWPELDIKHKNSPKVSTLFVKALKKPGGSVKVEDDEFDATKIALEMEIKSRDFYKAQAEKSRSETESSFFNLIADEEQAHYLALIDYNEYILDPAGWFTRTEHHSLDGA